ncbi:hypothetical protein ACFWA9_00705 [Kitasatospora sp. NPDC059973]|uniref:hypothetical protein n=1 Tax=Kitasatospora sp. NPDC059973 TaxID=3347020 RepID=UPI0036D088C2
MTDGPTHRPLPTERTAGPSDAPHGHYGELAGTPLVLYRHADGLRLWVGGEVIPLDGSVDVLHRVVGSDCVLTVGQYIEIRYPAPLEWYGLQDDLTPFAEAEDFDLGLFTANVVHDPGRSAQIYL